MPKESAHPCMPRKRFKSQETAKAACFRISHTNKVFRHPVYCEKCKGWHLS